MLIYVNVKKLEFKHNFGMNFTSEKNMTKYKFTVNFS